MGRPDHTLVSGRSCWTLEATSGHKKGFSVLPRDPDVRITGQRDAMGENLRRPATAEPYPSCQKDREDAYRRPAMSTPYQQSHEQPPGGMSTPGCIEMSDTPAPHFAVPRQEGRPAHRPV